MCVEWEGSVANSKRICSWDESCAWIGRVASPRARECVHDKSCAWNGMAASPRARECVHGKGRVRAKGG